MHKSSQEHQKSLPDKAASVVLVMLAAVLSLSSLFHGEITLPGMLHSCVFFFCLLILAQRSRLVAYLLLPLTLIVWLVFPVFYDLCGAFLHTHSLAEVITTARINQYYLRSIYGITPSACLLWATGFGILYGVIFCMRRCIRPVSLFNDTWTWIIAGLYTSISLLILPFGILCP